jgi:hypothetical protein
LEAEHRQAMPMLLQLNAFLLRQGISPHPRDLDGLPSGYQLRALDEQPS